MEYPMRSFLFVALAISAVACGGDACEKASTAMSDKVASCLPEVTDDTTETTDPVEVECTEALQTLVECQADCADAAPCGAFDGTDLDALTAYGECTAACATPAA